MFSCTKRQNHYGQIVNSICLQLECIKNKNQLACPVCIQEQHKSHHLNTMKKMLPQFLSAHEYKQKYLSMLHMLLDFVVQHFGQQNKNKQNITVDNIVERSIQIMTQLKGQVQTNNQEIYKMKDIFKNLNKNANNSNTQGSKLARTTQSKMQQKSSPQRSSQLQSSPMKSSQNNFSSPKSKLNYESGNSHNSIQTFSHTLKHPYISLSTDCRTATKSSHPGHRYSVLGSESLSPDQNQVSIKIDSSLSGNVMIGLCHQKPVKDKDFANNYGTSHGTYLIGQNGNNPDSAISFHHTINMMNRKQIVGWNFIQGDTVTVGFNFRDQYIYFRLHKGKGKALQFSMALMTQDNNNGQIRNLVIDSGLKLIVLLQNVGDQVSLI